MFLVFVFRKKRDKIKFKISPTLTLASFYLGGQASSLAGKHFSETFQTMPAASSSQVFREADSFDLDGFLTDFLFFRVNLVLLDFKHHPREAGPDCCCSNYFLCQLLRVG